VAYAAGYEEAEKRFNILVNLFSRLLTLTPLKPPQGSAVVSVLDVMAASGIAGAALASALVAKGYTVNLMVTDIRMSELAYVQRWIEKCKQCRGKVKVSYKKADATRLPEDVDISGWHYILVWGSSLGHLGSHHLNLLLTGAADLLSENGVLLIEQEDIGARIMLERNFKPVYAGENFLLIYKGYDSIDGTVIRNVFSLPQLKYLGQDTIAFWRIAEVIGRMELLYEEVYAIPIAEGWYGKKIWVLASKKPRRCRPSWRQLAEIQIKRFEV
jgi:hypothetical protein